MLRTFVRSLLIASTTVLLLPGQTPSGTAPAAKSTTALDQHALDKRTGTVLKTLGLDTAKATAVRNALEEHFQAVKGWHDAHDGEFSTLWTDWAAARTPPQKDEVKAGEIAARIDVAYAQFKPQHDAFIAALTRELTPTQIEQVKDALTKSPGLQRTYDAYLAMIPNFTDAQNAFIRQKLELAREQALDATNDKEKVSLFKKRKVEIEAYIDAQGLDYKTAYKAFADKIRK